MSYLQTQKNPINRAFLCFGVISSVINYLRAPGPLSTKPLDITAWKYSKALY